MNVARLATAAALLLASAFTSGGPSPIVVGSASRSPHKGSAQCAGMRKRIALALLATLLTACSGNSPAVETSNLFLSAAPDGHHSAKLDLVIGGPPIGGSVVWQELRIISPDSGGRPGQPDATLVLSSAQDNDWPCVTVRWLSPTKLLVHRQGMVNLTWVNSSVDGIQVLYEEETAP